MQLSYKLRKRVKEAIKPIFQPDMVHIYLNAFPKTLTPCVMETKHTLHLKRIFIFLTGIPFLWYSEISAQFLKFIAETVKNTFVKQKLIRTIISFCIKMS